MCPQIDNPSGRVDGYDTLPLWEVVQIGDVQKVHKLSGGKYLAWRDTHLPAEPSRLHLDFDCGLSVKVC